MPKLLDQDTLLESLPSDRVPRTADAIEPEPELVPHVQTVSEIDQSFLDLLADLSEPHTSESE
ncbi:MAG: hypothetical protein EOP84_29465 [Verrucomicrobiaceae bacterium]|nr:MAG: hypothetical protein EOP84_29465 [Verrucomicrobiaceae bacterium]